MGIGVEGVGGCVGPKIGDVHLHNLCVKPQKRCRVYTVVPSTCTVIRASSHPFYVATVFKNNLPIILVIYQPSHQQSYVATIKFSKGCSIGGLPYFDGNFHILGNIDRRP